MTPSVNYPLDVSPAGGGQQYPCSQKDAEECFSRPHTPIPPIINTQHTASAFTHGRYKRSPVQITFRARSLWICRVCGVAGSFCLMGSFSEWDDQGGSANGLSEQHKTSCAAAAGNPAPFFLVLIKQDTFLNSPNPQTAGLLCYLITACLSVRPSACGASMQIRIIIRPNYTLLIDSLSLTIATIITEA